MDKKRPLTERELQEIVDNLSDFDADIVDFADESEAEEEVIQYNVYDSESEQSAVEDSDCIHELENQGDEFFYIGKDEENVWKSTVSFTSKTRSKNIIKILPGSKGAAKTVSNHLESFYIFISNEMIDNIVTCTNLYIENKKQNFARDRDCKITSSTEIQALFGALYIIAVKKGNRVDVRELWSTDGTGMIRLRAAFSYRRFLFLLRDLQFDNINTRKGRQNIDKLAAIRDIYSDFVKNCMNNYIPGEFITIVEMLHPFPGRCGFVQYMPRKPAKYGIQIYALCDSRSYYTWNLEIYCGQQRDGPFQTSNKPFDIVRRLVDPLKNSKRNLTTDNYYRSYPLADYLLQNGLTLIGTI
ncbi:unnamed protein product [Acanthoscelides obtectus]|uniref:PiggyBac transposable element-derived protein domain-containing protein n=1 Tax=Acanthoscelides obtectus TaxID=200917 RepID=A0A9P0KHT5_ACAOB|nr:unnamed protein product [Acanthoscelides obtectus]CAK1648195.1 PiggyBac transposable element-derived protein 4 [Acanthoscelides obtectus]